MFAHKFFQPMRLMLTLELKQQNRPQDMTEIKGYKVLGVKLPPVHGHGAIHHLLFKKHEAKLGEYEDRSMFFSNVPINTDMKIWKRFFQNVAIGATVETYIPSYLTDSVEDTFLDLPKLTSDLQIESNADMGIDPMSTKLPRNCGVVTFIDKSAFQLAMNNLKQLSSKSKVVDWPLDPNDFGSGYFLAQFKSQILDVHILSNQVHQALLKFDQAEHESMESFKAQSELVDEDGFTLVVGPQRKTKAGILGQQKLAASKVDSDKAKTKEKKKEKQDFYRFQLRERKKEEMNELLRKFKSDQEKVRSMKDKKRFRPY